MNIFNKIKKNILGFIIGSIVFGGISYTIASQILATQVSYSNEKSEANVANVDGALTELYDIALDCINNSSNGSDITYKGKNVETIYLDPTNLSTTCTSTTSSETETKDGCMRFFVYAEDSEYRYAILDHNTTKKLNFYNAQSQVKQDTANWDPNLQARNISAMEVYKITESTNNKSNWQVNNGATFYFNGSNDGRGWGYGWLFDRTYDCIDYGCTTEDENVKGYWTSDMREASNVAWNVGSTGHLSNNTTTSSSSRGVRPVIQIAK